MYHWAVDFQMSRYFPNFPVPIRVAMETQFSSEYRNVCGNRHGGLFVYTMEGRGCFKKDDKIYELLPDTAYVICGSGKGIEYYYPPKEKKPWRFVWFLFEGSAAEKMLDDLINLYGHIYHFKKGQALIENIIKHQFSTSKNCIITPHDASRMVFGIISALAECFEQKYASGGAENMMRNVQKYVSTHLGGGLKINELAAKLGISREHLGRLFKDRSGITLSEYIVRQRMIYASYLLKESRKSVKEIASSAGYANTTNFCRAFKDYSGRRALDFRRNGSAQEIF